MGRYSSLSDNGKSMTDFLVWVFVFMGIIGGIVWVFVGE